MRRVIVIGAGLAGSECAWQLANRGIEVHLYEMRPHQMTPAHRTGNFAELVCSNTFGSMELTSGAGLLKEELLILDSLIIKTAKEFYVPAGTALAVDREKFSQRITEILTHHPNIKVFYEEVKKVPRDEVVVIASGPLTSPALAEDIKELVGYEYLYFYDAISPS
jgi:NAD(FAD)-utilizing enzyme possibly involved in translation